MGAIKAIVDALTSTIKNTIEGAAQTAQSACKMDLKGVADGACKALGLNDDDESQSASQASNTLMDRDIARMQAMMAQNAASQQNGSNGNSGGEQAFGGMRA